MNTNALGIPLWDRHVSAETNVEDTLWLCLAVLIAVVVTAAVEFAFARQRPGDEILSLMTDRLSAVENVLNSYAEGLAPDAPAEGRMWFVFDRLGGMPASVEMKRTFVSNLRFVARFATLPLSKDVRIALGQSLALRETINTNLDKVRALADGVVFEFGPSRSVDLELRSYIRQWQPQLRTLFIMRITFLKYRLQLPGFELPESVRLQQQAYDEHSARMLKELANLIEQATPPAANSIEDSHELLNKTVEAIQSQDSAQLPPGRAQSFITLLRGIDGLTESLACEIAKDVAVSPCLSS